ISLNLGLVNLLPIPALDGGHIVLYLIEIISGKPLPSYFQNILMRGGISLLLALMVLITINDISRFF
ncbi:MAG: site-2 protease family protein, partial [Candidatus Puniceispirillales bacterium]